MRKLYNKYGFDNFMFEGYEVTITKYSNSLCFVNDINNIYVNKHFMELDESTQNFVLYHELGHIHYKHNTKENHNKLYKIKRRFYCKLGLVVKEEIQADLYAAKQIGKENALRSIRNTIDLMRALYHVEPKELKTRELIIKIFG